MRSGGLRSVTLLQWATASAQRLHLNLQPVEYFYVNKHSFRLIFYTIIHTSGRTISVSFIRFALFGYLKIYDSPFHLNITCVAHYS